jgi:hypothetical protein
VTCVASAWSTYLVRYAVAIGFGFLAARRGVRAHTVALGVLRWSALLG